MLDIILSDLFLCLVVILSVLYLYWEERRKNLPPGPTGLPIVGYLPFLGKEAYKTLHQLTEKWGPIYSFYLGPKLVVVLGNFTVVKEAFSNDITLDRPDHPPNHLLPNSEGLNVIGGRAWKEQKRFSFKLLRQLGMDKEKMERQMLSEIMKMFSEIDKEKGGLVNLDALICPSVSNNILSLLIGHPLSYDNEERLFLDELLLTMTVLFRPTRIHAYFPWLKKWLAKWKMWDYGRGDYFLKKFSNYIESKIEDHKRKVDDSVNHPQDYIFEYLKSMKSLPDSRSYFSEKMLKGNFQSLFLAGSTPSRAALTWSISFMVQYPDMQAKVYEELNSVLDQEKMVCWSDHKRLPYTLAIIYESMRFITAVPISILRSTSARTQIAGYTIPKGTIIMPNLWGVHHDPKVWEDPFTFKPERFIRNGKNFKPQEFIPFSYGKRSCPGEDMGMKMVFLYFANLLLRYEISSQNESSSVKEVLGVARIAILDKMHLTPR